MLSWNNIWRLHLQEALRLRAAIRLQALVRGFLARRRARLLRAQATAWAGGVRAETKVPGDARAGLPATFPEPTARYKNDPTGIKHCAPARAILVRSSCTGSRRTHSHFSKGFRDQPRSYIPNTRSEADTSSAC